MLGNVIHPQIVDNLAMGLVARFNIKDDPKNVIKFIKKFSIEGEEDTVFIPSGFPIGKIQSLDHLRQIQKDFNKNKVEGEKDQYYNVTTGKLVKYGNQTMYYGDGWCVKRNTPAHQAMSKVEESDNSEADEIEIDEYHGWEVVKDTKYIWSRTLGKIVGYLKSGNAIPLTQKHIEAIKESSNIPWERLPETMIPKHKIPEVLINSGVSKKKSSEKKDTTETSE
uniref:Uncharacterized protein n=1 Tax=viral metagenome TaxID=1070528 RepID=A0A6C0JRL6_9ZZZZ